MRGVGTPAATGALREAVDGGGSGAVGEGPARYLADGASDRNRTESDDNRIGLPTKCDGFLLRGNGCLLEILG